MAGNMPYYNEATCEGHYCAKDCDLCPYRDEAMEFCQKLDECDDVPWAWLESYAIRFIIPTLSGSAHFWKMPR